MLFCLHEGRNVVHRIIQAVDSVHTFALHCCTYLLATPRHSSSSIMAPINRSSGDIRRICFLTNDDRPDQLAADGEESSSSIRSIVASPPPLPWKNLARSDLSVDSEVVTVGIFLVPNTATHLLDVSQTRSFHRPHPPDLKLK